MAEKKKKSRQKPAAPVKRKKKKVEEAEKLVKTAAPEIKAEVIPEAAAAPAPEPIAAPVEAKKFIVAKPSGIKLPPGTKYYGTGRRKEAVAKVWLANGSGKISVNNKPSADYFCRRMRLEFQLGRPFEVTKTAGRYDVFAEVFGGGVPGQATAVTMGISRALVRLNPENKVLLKREGLLTRDPRMKERKKYGRKRARKRFQYTKR
jgi:small subunit ribosomal protein S9